MDPIQELFRYHAWATVQLIDYCLSQPAATLHELVIGTDRSILHTLTHVAGTEQWYLELLTGEPAANPIQRGEALDLSDLRQRLMSHSGRWEALLEQIEQLQIVLPATEWRPEIVQGQVLLVVQAIHHGIDHRSQICTTLAVLGLEPPIIDGWFYWPATH
ncbi:MAG: DinB family protein [Roseiflexaceae bacterium]